VRQQQAELLQILLQQALDCKECTASRRLTENPQAFIHAGFEELFRL